jgi:NAD(P)H-hydrate epimerase
VAKIVTVEEMIAIEKEADAAGLTYDQMMENAGKSVADHILVRWSDIDKCQILVLVGPGNNGGDGLVAGYYLSQAGAKVSYYLLKDRSTDDENFKRVQEAQAQIATYPKDKSFTTLNALIETSDIIVDGVLGTGFKLPLQETAARLLGEVKQSLTQIEGGLRVVAIDCPSGMDCNSGEAASECIHADLTVTLAATKIGLLKHPGADLAGEIVVGDIGLENVETEIEGIQLEMMDPEIARSWIPTRPSHAHKGTFGRVLIVAGSINYPGAAILAAKGAYRSGAGLVTVAVPEPIYQPLVGVLPEATWIILPNDQGAITSAAADVIAESLSSTQALLVGPGFGLERQSQQFLARLFSGSEAGERLGFIDSKQKDHEITLPPIVLDADALKLLADLDDWASLIPAKSVLTPHPGEMSVLCGLPVEQIQADRIGAAQHWAHEWGHVLVLKGAFTVVASPKGSTMVVPIATPALAKAGTGDVLAGVIASLIAQGLKPYMAAALGAYLHGRAGLITAEVFETTVSIMAGDVVDALPEVFADLLAV